MIDIDPQKAAVWEGLGKTSLDMLRSAWNLLPKGETKDEIEHELVEAEKALNESKAKLARDLGYKLCQCTFPPQIMLWQDSINSHVCPNPACNHRIERPRAVRVARGGSWGT
jgi:hypothetical protein